jgi:hypothetical protein
MDWDAEYATYGLLGYECMICFVGYCPILCLEMAFFGFVGVADLPVCRQK